MSLIKTHSFVHGLDDLSAPVVWPGPLTAQAFHLKRVPIDAQFATTLAYVVLHHSVRCALDF